MTATAIAGCNLGSYDDAVEEFNRNAPPPPPPPPPGGFGPSFSEIQTFVFTPDCASAGCHGGVNPAADLNLEAGSSYTNLVGVAAFQDSNVQLVNPGNPDMSYLITKLEGPGVTGGRMPPGSAMPQSEIDVIRQWITDGAIDDTAAPTSPIRVTTLSPMPGADLQSAPTQIVAGFDRELDATSVDMNTFLLDGSGGDGIFGNGNDVSVSAASITVPGANPQSAVFDLTGVMLADDTYQVTLLGDGATTILDLDGNALDGEFSGGFPSGDGVAGGDFTATFSITTPGSGGPTLDEIQATIFTPSCASAACHDAVNPAENLDLSDADTSHMELVGVATTQLGGAGILVIPGDPDNSYLVQKLENANGIEGLVMPPGAPLQQSQIDSIRQWIMDGALR